MRKAIFIVGPTAVGKTNLAVKIFKKIPSVLISADSIQVYKGADIISGKDHPKDVGMELIDVLESTESFSVRDFVDLVKPIVEAAELQNKLPVIVGGTGLYVSSLFSKIETVNIPPNKDIRDDLNNLDVQNLQENLKKLEIEKFESMNYSDRNNPRRLIRAIEIALSKSTIDPNFKDPIFRTNDVLIIGLEIAMDELKEKINTRVEDRIKSGAIDEARRLFENYDDLSPQLKVSNGYRELFEYLKGEIPLEQAIQKWKIADYQHAKAQITWFKKNKNIMWFNVEENDLESEILVKLRTN